MNILNSLIKLFLTTTAIFLVSIGFIVHPVYAQNITGSFGRGTLISTPDGDVAVEELKSGDRVIGYNFKIHQTEENIVQEIRQKSPLSYYLINNQVKLTGTSLVYIRTKTNPQVVRLYQLKLRDKLFGQKNFPRIIESVEQIIETTDVYQVVLENPVGNLYANNLLVHVGTKIPALFKRESINCDPGTPYFKQCANVTPDTLPGFFMALTILILGIVILGNLIVKLLIYIPNFLRFHNRKFTDDYQLINFAKNINYQFTNHYSIKYYQGNKVWLTIPLQPEIEESKYDYLVNRQQLLKQVNYLFVHYNQDLVHKNFANISKYFLNFATEQKYQDYQRYFSDNFNIIYLPKINKIAVIDFQSEANIFKIQINAEMVNFVISEAGYVLTGESKIQQYSEYWEIELISDGKCYIKSIEETLTTKILQGDLRARREVYAEANTGVG